MPETDIGNKLAWASKNLNKVHKILNRDSIAELDGRQATITTVSSFINELDTVIDVLPNSIKYQKQDISSELRKIRNSATGIVQALSDRVCNVKTARKLLKPVAKDLTVVRNLLTGTLGDRIVAQAGRSGVAVDNVEVKVAQAVIAADRPKIILHDLSELSNYDQFMKEMQEKVAKLDEAIRQENGEADVIPAVQVDPKLADAYTDSLQRGAVNFHFNENKYGERVNQNVLETQQALTNVYDSLPKSVHIGKPGYALVKAPVIAVTQHFIPDSVLRKSGLVYERLSSSFSAGYTPGLSTQTGVNSSYIIFLKQLLLAFPVATLRDPKTFGPVREGIMRSLERNLGKLVVISFGKGSGQNTEDLIADRRHFFGNPHYPGVGFIWVMPQAIFNIIHNVQYLQVNIATAPDMKKELTREPTGSPEQDQRIAEEKRKARITDNPLIQQKAEREQTQDARLQQIAELRAQRELITGPLLVQLNQLKVEKTKIKQQVEQLANNLAAGQLELTRQNDALRRLLAGSPGYKAQLAAIALTQAALQQAEAELKALSEDKLAELKEKRRLLAENLQSTVNKFLLQRKKAKKPKGK